MVENNRSRKVVEKRSNLSVIYSYQPHSNQRSKVMTGLKASTRNSPHKRLFMTKDRTPNNLSNTRRFSISSDDKISTTLFENLFKK
jgi:hypothetical protein